MDHREEPVEVRETQPLNDDQPTKLSQFNKWVGNQKRELNQKIDDKDQESVHQFEYIQNAQQSVLLIHFISFALALVVCVLFMFLNLFIVMNNFALISSGILLFAFVLCLLITWFGGERVQKKHGNTLVFLVHLLLLVLLCSLLTVGLPSLHFQFVLLLLLTDLALIFGFFKWDSNHAEYSCFLIYDNKWRILITFLVQGILTSVLLQITSPLSILFWFLAACYIYMILLINLQMVQNRPFFRQNSNDWFLATAYLSIDILFPCEWILTLWKESTTTAAMPTEEKIVP